MKQIVKYPTYPSNNPNKLIDLIFTNNDSIIYNVDIVDNITSSCDHLSLTADIRLTKKVSKPKSLIRRNYSNENLLKLNDSLQSVNWLELTDNVFDIEIIYMIIVEKYIELLDTHIPKTNSIRNKKPFTFEIRRLISMRRKLFKDRHTDYNFNYKYQYLTEIIGNRMTEYESFKIDELIDNNNNIYSIYKHIRKQTNTPIAKTFIDSEGNRISDKNMIVDKFKNLFGSQYKVNNENNLLISKKPNVVIFDNIVLTMNKFTLAIKKFNFNKSQGETFIDNTVIKKCQSGSYKMLFALYYRILELEKIPSPMKISIITPVCKPNKNKNYFESHRCVSVQPNTYRIFETIILLELKPYLEINHSISDSQYGYRSGIGLHNIHLDMQKVIYETFNNKKYIGIDLIFLDLSDAFNSVNHSRLISKLKINGIDGKILNIFKDSFNNRKQIVKYENTFSSMINITSGCIQGGVLSPTLFNIYIADMKNIIKSYLFCFADDTVILRPIFNRKDSEILQNDINTLIEYFEQNNLKLNSTKCKFMRISNKLTIPFVYHINSDVIASVSQQKHIGVIYDTKMLFNFHVNYKIEKTLKRFNFIRFIGKRMDGKTLLKLYKTYLLPILEYSNLCLTLTKTQTERIEIIQKKITRYICFKNNLPYLNYINRLSFLNLKMLKTRRLIQTMKFFYKIKVCFPTISQNLIEQVNFVMNNNNCLAIIKQNRIQLSDKYLLNYCCNIFNDLPIILRNENNFGIFMFLINNEFKL